MWKVPPSSIDNLHVHRESNGRGWLHPPSGGGFSDVVKKLMLDVADHDALGRQDVIIALG